MKKKKKIYVVEGQLFGTEEKFTCFQDALDSAITEGTLLNTINHKGVKSLGQIISIMPDGTTSVKVVAENGSTEILIKEGEE